MHSSPLRLASRCDAGALEVRGGTRACPPGDAVGGGSDGVDKASGCGILLSWPLETEPPIGEALPRPIDLVSFVTGAGRTVSLLLPLPPLPPNSPPVAGAGLLNSPPVDAGPPPKAGAPPLLPNTPPVNTGAAPKAGTLPPLLPNSPLVAGAEPPPNTPLVAGAAPKAGVLPPPPNSPTPPAAAVAGALPPPNNPPLELLPVLALGTS